jgi:hypothetical protein
VAGPGAGRSIDENLNSKELPVPSRTGGRAGQDPDPMRSTFIDEHPACMATVEVFDPGRTCHPSARGRSDALHPGGHWPCPQFLDSDHRRRRRHRDSLAKVSRPHRQTPTPQDVIQLTTIRSILMPRVGTPVGYYQPAPGGDPMRLRFVSAIFFAGLIAGACGSSGGGGNNPDAAGATALDSDGDHISDVDEGRATNTDTDGDGTPDYLDTDSDNDGIPDYREGGDDNVDTRPVDSDSDGVPDFRDTDSDANGILDGTDGAGDVDSDGKPDFADLDDDNDLINDVLELGPDPAHPLDSDGDGTADYRDTDSDNDTIPDFVETSDDYDLDGTGNWRDSDSDQDCRSDQIEANGNPTRDTDSDGHYDFIDRDSDDDGILDSAEDKNCNGITDPGETSAVSQDTDGDGVSDLVEVAAGTNPTDPTSNPQANGDFVFVEPYTKPQTPTDDDLAFSTKLQQVDMYVILDRSGSMSTEISAVKANLATVINNLQCPPLGNGSPATCIPNLWAGAGTMGYSGSTGGEAYHHVLDVQENPAVSTLPITEPNGCCTEDEPFSVYSAITGNGTASQPTCGIQTVNPRATCVGSPAGASGYGYPCFRPNSLPVILLATDEGPLNGADTNHCPDWDTVVKPAMTSRKARLVGILGSGYSPEVLTDLNKMATDTGAVDATTGAPYVLDGAGANASTAIENGVRNLANNIPLDMNAVPTDDTTDTVDALAAFFDHLETLQLGTVDCANGLTDIDTNSDSFKDKYLQVKTGTPVCWKVVSKMNTTVPATSQPQLFKAFVTVYGDGVTSLSTRNVFFLVPPAPADVPVN